MSKVLIIANIDDYHSICVEKRLKKRKIQSIIWSPKDFIASQTSQIIFDNHNQSYVLYNQENVIDVTNIDIVWFRRPTYPALPKTIHEEDIDFVEKENRMHMKALWLTLHKFSTWINPLTSFDKANCKVTQLREAVNVGFTIPKTLISNNKKSISSFINENNKHETIYKTFSPPAWKETNNIFCFQTSLIKNEMLPDCKTLQLTPGIYQQRIEKAYELRVIFLGDHNIAVKIHNDKELDWRRHSVTEKLKMTVIKLPELIAKKCILLMQKLEIIFGCFDIIVTPDDNYIFLEVNEMGQFLWLDQKLPELKILDTFCDFLISSSKNKFGQYTVPQNSLQINI